MSQKKRRAKVEPKPLSRAEIGRVMTSALTVNKKPLEYLEERRLKRIRQLKDKQLENLDRQIAHFWWHRQKWPTVIDEISGSCGSEVGAFGDNLIDNSFRDVPTVADLIQSLDDALGAVVEWADEYGDGHSLDELFCRIEEEESEAA